MKFLYPTIAFAFFITMGTVSASSWFETTGHVGAICVPCHQRFSGNVSSPVKNPEVLTMFPCYKPGCHRYNPKYSGGIREALHLKICTNCHAVDIHKNHFNFSSLQPPWELQYPANITLRKEGVPCRFCHAMPEGYNSTVASVPPWNKSLLQVGIYKPPWNNNCAYCHPSVREASRLHEVHEPTILKACPVCHTSNIFPSSYVERIAGEKALEKKVIKKVIEPLPFREFRAYFESIIKQMIKIYASFRGEPK